MPEQPLLWLVLCYSSEPELQQKEVQGAQQAEKRNRQDLKQLKIIILEICQAPAMLL